MKHGRRVNMVRENKKPKELKAGGIRELPVGFLLSEEVSKL
jgi:hypothetical protein